MERMRQPASESVEVVDIMHLVRVLLHCVIGLPVLCLGSSQVSALHCIDKTELPRYAVVEVVRGTSTVNATVIVGAAGKAGKVEISSDHPLTGDEVRYHLTELTAYKQECSGKTINLTFKFVYSGRASYSPNIRSFFAAPATFIIEADSAKSGPQVLPRQ